MAKQRAQRSESPDCMQIQDDIFNALPQPALLICSDGQLLSANQAFLNISGQAPSNLLERGWLHQIDAHARNEIEANLTAGCSNYQGFETEVQLKSNGDLRRWFALRALPLTNADGRWLFLFDRQKLEILQEKAAREEQIFKLMVANVKDYAIFMLDPSGHVKTWNEGAQRIKGYKPEEIIGKHFSEFYTNEARDSKHPDYELRIAASQGRYEEEGWRLRKDGTLFWANVVITALYDDDGKLLGFAKVTRDLTERKQAENELRETNEELARANTAKDIFLANMSHELRTPLNSIIGFNDVMMMGLTDPLTPNQMKQADYIRRAAEHLLSLINDILDLAKIESGKMELSIEPHNINHIVAEVIEGLQPLAKERNLYLRMDNPAHEFFVLGDDRSIRQIATNLISNAIKFTDKGGVAVSIHPHTDAKVAISVSDTGIGISKDDQSKLFKGFVQLARSQRKQEGTGLGLALSKRLANLMQGDITLTSEANSGSTFTIHLPMLSVE